ncbi:MAG: LacI family DNA-binding transcriptional regulator [Eubacteriales bacterium]|nr:LacI family DNA-binding transcriptional regulator [Eubacteriales bacterium]
MPTKLKDIAAELNLSVSTISRVVNGKDRVDKKTRERVLKALDKYGYRPNEIARALCLQTAKIIVVLVPDIANNFYATVLKGAQAVCQKSGYSLNVINTDENKQTEWEAISGFTNQLYAGIIIASVDNSTKLVQYLRQQELPVVFVDNIPLSTLNYDSVTINNVSAAYDLTMRMVKRGYKRIGFISGNLEQSSGNERLKGYKQALSDADLPYDEARIVKGDFKKKSGYDGMKTLIERSVLDSVIVCNNFMTYGAIKAIREAELKIPEDIAVAAFDVVDESELICPKITSIYQPAMEIGECAAEILLNRIKSKHDGIYNNRLLDTTFYAGDSW